jgi:hypothetical protein
LLGVLTPLGVEVGGESGLGPRRVRRLRFLPGRGELPSGVIELPPSWPRSSSMRAPPGRRARRGQGDPSCAQA